MSRFFFDTSALARRYLSEDGHKWVKAVTEPTLKNLLLLSDTTSVEAFSVFARYERSGLVTPATAIRLRRVFLFHLLNQYTVIKIDDSMLQDARTFVTNHTLRAMDSLQLACAVRARHDLRASITFISADKRLLAAATAEGFATDDPTRHP